MIVSPSHAHPLPLTAPSLSPPAPPPYPAATAEPRHPHPPKRHVRPGQAGAAMPKRLPLQAPRLSALAGLTQLQRLALHFFNPAARPAVVAHGSLPPSLTSLSLRGVVLLPDPAGPGPGPDAGPAANAGPGPSSSRSRSRSLLAGADAGCDGCGHAGGLRLGRLRELSLLSSWLERADLLGCGGGLTLLSVRESGCTAGPGGAAGLLRAWHGLRVLRISGKSTYARPGGAYARTALRASLRVWVMRVRTCTCVRVHVRVWHAAEACTSCGALPSHRHPQRVGQRWWRLFT